MSSFNSIEEFSDQLAEIVGQARGTFDVYKREVDESIRELQAAPKPHDWVNTQLLEPLQQMAHNIAGIRASQDALTRSVERQMLSVIEGAVVPARRVTEQASAVARESGTQDTRASRSRGWRSVLYIVVLAFAGAGFLRIVPPKYLEHLSTEIQAKHAQLGEIQAAAAEAQEYASQIDVRPCGPTDQRLCVRVDRKAGTYGTNGDFAVAARKAK